MSFPSASIRTKDWGSEILTDSALEAQFDILHQYMNDMLNSSSGHGHSGGGQDGPKIDLTAGVQNTLPLANGGTGVATLAALGNIFYPIGSTYVNIVDSTNPATLLGFGTWIAINGKFIIGFDSSDVDFATAGTAGGAKTKDTSHTHTVSNTGWGTDVSPSSGKLLAGPNDGGASSSGNGVTSGTGGSATQDVMNPFIVGYVWYRTA